MIKNKDATICAQIFLTEYQKPMLSYKVLKLEYDLIMYEKKYLNFTKISHRMSSIGPDKIFY